MEGRYYVFTPEEIRQVLGPDRGDAFCSQYGITGKGNFEGRNIPNLLENEDFEAAGGEASPGAGMDVQACCRKLYDYRIRRARLHKDDKILVSWNGWMICACAMAGAVLGMRKYVDMAAGAEAFIRTHLVKDGRLLVRFLSEASAIAPGQSAVFYVGRRVVGGSFIASQRGIGMYIAENNKNTDI